LDYAKKLLKDGEIDQLTDLVEIGASQVRSPSLTFQNALSLEDQTDYGDNLVINWKTVDDELVPFVQKKARQLAVFSQKMPLGLFPFDTQKLTILYYCTRPLSEVRIVPDDAPSVMDAKRAHVQEWKISPEIDIQSGESDPSASSKNTSRSEFLLNIHVERKVGSYVWNIFFILNFLVAASWISFLIPADQVSDRMSVILTLLLTAVAYKLAISQSVPKISYLSLLDYYVIGCFTIFYLALLESGVLALLLINNAISQRTGRIVDIVTVVILGILMFVSQVAIYFVVKKSNRK